jgi:hypothetical protein
VPPCLAMFKQFATLFRRQTTKHCILARLCLPVCLTVHTYTHKTQHTTPQHTKGVLHLAKAVGLWSPPPHTLLQSFF